MTCIQPRHSSCRMIIRQRVKPMPSREELLKRKSFGSVNDNKYLNAMLRKGGNQ